MFSLTQTSGRTSVRGAARVLTRCQIWYATRSKRTRTLKKCNTRVAFAMKSFPGGSLWGPTKSTSTVSSIDSRPPKWQSPRLGHLKSTTFITPFQMFNILLPKFIISRVYLISLIIVCKTSYLVFLLAAERKFPAKTIELIIGQTKLLSFVYPSETKYLFFSISSFWAGEQCIVIMKDFTRFSPRWCWTKSICMFQHWCSKLHMSTYCTYARCYHESFESWNFPSGDGTFKTKISGPTGCNCIFWKCKFCLSLNVMIVESLMTDYNSWFVNWNCKLLGW